MMELPGYYKVDTSMRSERIVAASVNTQLEGHHSITIKLKMYCN